MCNLLHAEQLSFKLPVHMPSSSINHDHFKSEANNAHISPSPQFVHPDFPLTLALLLFTLALALILAPAPALSLSSLLVSLLTVSSREHGRPYTMQHGTAKQRRVVYAQSYHPPPARRLEDEKRFSCAHVQG